MALTYRDSSYMLCSGAVVLCSVLVAMDYVVLYR
jgi:hypothetical protein